MTKINYRSDFDFILHLRTANGQEAGWPDYDWRARIYTSQKVNAVIVSNIGGELTNCFNDNGSIHAVINNHRLTPGVLHIEFEALIPNGLYPDGDEKVVVPEDLDIELVRQASDCPTDIEITLILPYVLASAYDLASANGYEGTQEEYNTALTELPAVVDTARMVESMLTDVAHGKAELADTLRRAGQDVADDAPLPVMAEAVRSLNLTPEDAPQGSAVTFADFGMSAPVNLLNVLHTHQRAGYGGWFGVALNSVAVTLAGADAYLTSDGVWTEEPGRVEFPSLPSVTTITVQPGYRQTLNIASLTNLTAECLTQLIMNLGDNNDRDTVTLTLGSANIAKLSDDDIAAAQAKNFTLA